MIKVTELQGLMLEEIARSDYTNVNGQEPKTIEDVGDIWASTIITSAQWKGVFTSLLNAGLVKHFGSGEEATICLTQKGFDAYKSL